MDVRYMTNIKSYIEKFKSIYNCEPQGCPALKERLHTHRSQHHPDYQSDEQDLGRECSSLQHRLEDHCKHHQDGVKGNTAQTKITLSNLGTLTISIESESTNMGATEGGQSNENNETPEETAHRYGMNVEEQVKYWINNIPFRPNETESDVIKRENVVNTLINSIEGLAGQMQAINYNDKVKSLIENAVNNLDVFYPGPKRDQAAFREGLRENMFQRLKEMNDKFLAGHDRIEDTYADNDYGPGKGRRSIANDGVGVKRLSFAPHKLDPDSEANGLNATSVPNEVNNIVHTGDPTQSFIANTTTDTNYATGTPSFSVNGTVSSNRSNPSDKKYENGRKQSISPDRTSQNVTTSGLTENVQGRPRQSNSQGSPRQNYAQGGPRISYAQGGSIQNNGKGSPSQNGSPRESRRSTTPSGQRPSLIPNRLSKAQNEDQDQRYANGRRQSYAQRETTQSFQSGGPRQSISHRGSRQIVEQNQITNQNVQRQTKQDVAPSSGRQNIAPGVMRSSMSPGGPVRNVSPNQSTGNNDRDATKQGYIAEGPRLSMASGGIKKSNSPTGPRQSINQNSGGRPRQSYVQGGQRQSMTPNGGRQNILTDGTRQSQSPTGPQDIAPNQNTGQNQITGGARQSYATQGGQRPSYTIGGPRQSMTPNGVRQNVITGGVRLGQSPISLTQDIGQNQDTGQNQISGGGPRQNYAQGGQRQSMTPNVGRQSAITGGARQSQSPASLTQYAANQIRNQNAYTPTQNYTSNAAAQNSYNTDNQINYNGTKLNPYTGTGAGQSLQHNYTTGERHSNVNQTYGGGVRQSYAQDQNQSILPNETLYLPRQSISQSVARHSISVNSQRPNTAPAGLNQNFNTNATMGMTDNTNNNYGIVGTKLSVAPNKVLDISFEPLETTESQTSSPSGTYTTLSDGTNMTNMSYESNQSNENTNYYENARPSSSPAGYGPMGGIFTGRPTNTDMETSRSYVISNNDGTMLPYRHNQVGGEGYNATQNINGSFHPDSTLSPSNDYQKGVRNFNGTNSNNGNYNPANIDAFERNNNANQNLFNKPNYMMENENECQTSRKTKRRYSISGICSSLENVTKCTIPSGDLCSCLGDKQKPKRLKVCCGPKKLDMEKEIANWLKRTSILNDTGINKKEIIDALLTELGPFLATSSDKINKTVLKAKVVEILKSLGICPANMGNLKYHIYKFADDLSNRIIGIISRLECSGGGSWKCGVIANRPFNKLEQVTIGPNEVLKVDLKTDLIQEINKCLLNTRLAHDRFVEEDIADLIIARIELIRTGMEDLAREDIKFVLDRTEKLSDIETEIVTNSIMNSAREIITIINNIDNRSRYSTVVTARSCLSGTLSIYTSEHEITPAFNSEPISSSTPKKNKRTDIKKFSPEEKTFTTKYASIIREWIKNLPKPFVVEADANMIELMANDLAGEIVDHIKILQLAPDPNCDTKMFITFYIYKWLMKFEVLEELSDAEPYTQTLVTQLLQQNIPNLTRSHYGTRQANKNIQYRENDAAEAAWMVPFIPEAQDILEDEISIWMNQQSSNIYVNNDKTAQNEMVHEIAEKIKTKLAADKENADMTKEIKEWMGKVVKPNEIHRVDSLSNSLMERIKKLPQDETIQGKIQEKIRAKTTSAPPISINNTNSSNQTTESDDYENLIKSFVLKYIQHNCDTDDTLAKGAYIQLLKSELKKFGPLTRNELYNKAEAGATGDAFISGNLNRELEYVKDVSDWLKNIPIDSSYNRVGNKERIELVIGLAKNIVEVEEERKRAPQAMDYNLYLGGIILQFLEQVPVLPDQKNNVTLMIEQLLSKIISRVNQGFRPVQQTGLSTPEIIEEYIRIYGQEIVDDELKLEVWTARLLKEVKKMIAETSAENVSPEDISRLATVALLGDESVRRFNLELDYAKEIADWVKNFPVTKPIDVLMVYDLAKKIADHEDDTSTQLNVEVDKELNDYIKSWISQLPLDSSKEIDVPFVIHQLQNRIDKVKCIENKTLPSFDSSKSKSRRKSNKANKQGCATCPTTEDPGAVVVKVVEDWCKSLPLEGGKKDEITKAKDDVARRLYQTIGELNDNPRYFHNETVYEQAISDEVDKQLNGLPENLKLKGKQEDIKSKFVDSLLTARTQIKDMTAGIIYKKQLEDIIDTSMPNPLQIDYDDPEFELYKNNLAALFLLDNFDHSNDAVKLKYEKKIKNELDKYSPNALHRNAIPLTKEQLYNELYSSMYKVQLPNQCPLGDEVRVIKTKCEINDWFETLPINRPTDAAQILEVYTKQDILAKRVQFLEKEKKSSEKIFNEIVKWLNKIPLLANEKDNVNNFAFNLQERLKNTHSERKCFRPWDVKSKESTAMFKFGETSKSSKDKKRASNEVEHWISPNTSIEVVQNECKQKSGDALIEIVEMWCNNLPLPANIPEDQQRSTKEDIATKILIKISELNSDPQTFNQEQIYHYLLNEELERLIGMLPESNLLLQSKEAIKQQLISAIDSVKPLVREEKSRYDYVKDLGDMVDIFIEVPEKTNSKKAALHTDVKEKVISGFVEYQHNRDDEEAKQHYKNVILEVLARYNYNISTEKDVGKSRGEALMLGNQLICELSKIPIPSEQALIDEVQEIRMKQEVETFLNKVSPRQSNEEKNVLRNQLKNSLAKELSYIEKKGHTISNDERMKSLISKTMKKLRHEVSDKKVDDFINKLKESEKFRKTAPLRKAYDGNASLPVYIHEGKYPVQNAQPLSQSLPVGTYQRAFDPAGTKQPISSPSPMSISSASRPVQVQPEMVSNQIQASLTPNQIQSAMPTNQIQSAMLSNQSGIPSNQSGIPYNQFGIPSNQSGIPSNQSGIQSNQSGIPPNQSRIPSNQSGIPPNQSKIPSNQTRLPASNQNPPTLTSTQMQPAATSNRTQPIAPYRGPGPDPESLSKALKPLIMSFPTEEALQTWNTNDSGAVLVRQRVDATVHRPNALSYVPNTGTYVPRQTPGQHLVSPRRPPSSLDLTARKSDLVTGQGSQNYPRPMTETGVQISGPIPLLHPVSETGIQYEANPSGPSRTAKSRTTGTGPSNSRSSRTTGTGPFVDELAEDPDAPEECYCDMYQYMPCDNMDMPMLAVCESCGDVSAFPYQYLY